MKRSTARSQLWSRFPAFSTVPDQVSRPGGRLNEAHRTSQDVGATTLLSGWTETVRSIVTTGCLLVVLLDNGPTAPWIRPDLPGRPRRVGGNLCHPHDFP